MLKRLIKSIPGARGLAVRLGLARKSTGRRGFLLDMLPGHAIGAEIGVHKGDFSREVLDCTSPEELHLIDPWEHHASTTYENAWYGGKAEGGQREMDERYTDVCRRFAEEVRSGRVEIHRGYSTEVLDQFPDGYFDWIYIDGNHLYDYVKQDLELSLRKTKSQGLIAGDDYTEGGWWEGGVKKAVDEISEDDAVQLLGIRDEQFVLRKVGPRP